VCSVRMWLRLTCNQLTMAALTDITPKTDKERMIALLACFIGTVVFAYVTGQIQAFVSVTATSKLEIQGKMDALEEFMRYYKFPPAMRVKLRSHYQDVYKEAFFDANEIMETMPEDLRDESVMVLRQEVLRSSGDGHVPPADAAGNPETGEPPNLERHDPAQHQCYGREHAYC
jgi:hypothetical protein